MDRTTFERADAIAKARHPGGCASATELAAILREAIRSKEVSMGSAQDTIDAFEFCLTDPRQLDADNLAILRDEEDEPDFSAIIKRARARCEEYHCEDAQMIRDLLLVIQHYDNTLHSYFWNMSDNDQLPEGA